MRKDGERVTELGGLMDAMTVNRLGSRKTGAEMRLLHPGEYEVVQHFDTGKGHSGAFYNTYSPVEASVAEDALARRYLTGKLEPGCVSTTEFVLTRDKSLLDEIYRLAAEWSEKDYWTKRSEYDVKHGKPGTYLRIVKLDEPQLPEDARTASIYAVLPADPVVRSSEIAGGHGEKQRETARLRLVYSAPREEALKVLSDRSRYVAAYWEKLSFPRTDMKHEYFYFHGTEVEEFAGTFMHRMNETE